MSSFQQGTVEAFNELVDRFSEKLLRYLHGFGFDARMCEDLLQETLVRVYRNRHSYRRIARFSTWVYTIAGNLARSEYRKRRRYVMTSLHGQNRDGEEYEYPLPDEGHSPDDLTEASFQRDRVQEALAELPLEFREPVVLRDIQQLTYEEIAEITGLPMGTVKSRINRGRTKLQQLLRDIYPYERRPSRGAEQSSDLELSYVSAHAA